MADGQQEEVGQSRVVRAIGTSIRGNSTAFGFSIMITATFGVISHIDGSPDLLELFLFGLGAATGVALLEGAVTKGFRAVIEQTSQEVRMLGTAMDMASVAGAIAVALAIAELLGAPLSWAVAPFSAALTFIALESLELMLAEAIQNARGAPTHESEEEES